MHKYFLNSKPKKFLSAISAAFSSSSQPSVSILSPSTLNTSEKFLNPMIGSGLKTDTTCGQSFMPPEIFQNFEGHVNVNSAFVSDQVKDQSIFFVKASPRREIKMNPDKVKAAIVTCGGLCPGLNVVVRELVMSLYYNYGTTEIYGIYNGYKGFYTEGNIKKLTPSDVSSIHTLGGTMLKTSRGGWDLQKISKSIEDHKFNQIYIIGGDGTHRGVTALVNEMKLHQKPVSVIGIPKTIDNDIPIIDKSFGFDSSVEEAQRAIESANVEATSVQNGVGLVKLMGRNSGFIAMHSSLSNRNVNLCIIPESDFDLNGPHGVYRYVINRLRNKGHIVIVVAEGAASGCKDEQLLGSGKDPSGNLALYDIGKHLREGITRTCKEAGIEAVIKYLDPTYMVRSIGANASDRLLCTSLAQGAVHGAFSGYTGFSVGVVAGQTVFIPVDLMTTMCEGRGAYPGQRRVDIENNLMWWRLMASTGQPSFRPS